MLLWDLEMRGERALLDEFTPRQRLQVGVDALAWTLDTLPSPIETDQIRDYLSRGVDVARRAVAAGATRIELSPVMADEFEDVEEMADEPGTSHFLAALMACHDVESELDPEQLFGILSYCYEGSLDREGLDEWSPENERQDQRCVDVIEYQKGLIQRAVGRS